MALRQSSFALAKRMRGEDLGADSRTTAIQKDVQGNATGGAWSLGNKNLLSTYRKPWQQPSAHCPLSDFGSLNTVARSPSDLEDSSDADRQFDDELDSLDEGLLAFQEPSLQQQSRPSQVDIGTVLPAHDGLGSFIPSRGTPDARDLGAEELRPKDNQVDEGCAKRSTIPPSCPVHDVEKAAAPWLDEARMERIQRWRLDQSDYMLTERRKAAAPTQRKQHATMRSCHSMPSGEPLVQGASCVKSDDALWERITCHIIQDIMRIDDSVLCIIFGEELPQITEPSLSTMSAETEGIRAEGLKDTSESWQIGLLRQLKDELSRFVQQPSSHASTSSLQREPFKVDYAGMPVDWLHTRHCGGKMRPFNRSTAEAPMFLPTLRCEPTATTRSLLDDVVSLSPDAQTSSTRERDSRHQNTSVRNLLRLLYRRFLAQDVLSEERTTGLAISQNTEAQRRAAIIQRHHPLVAHLYQSEPGSRNVGRQDSAFQGANPPRRLANLKRPHNSCASVSSKRRSRCTTSEGGSRNYWDAGASIGTGSAVLAGAGVW